MEVASVPQFLRGKTMLVTGAAGFLAKVFVEKVLRIQSDLKKLYLLLRASDSEAATQRLHDEIIRKDLFRVLRDKWGADFESLIAEKVVPVAGDVSLANLGIKDASLEKMWEEIDIIANFAANTNFDERYDIAMEINTMGALHVLNFARSCHKIQVFLHVSTAYVCGEPEERELIKEEPFRMGESLKEGFRALDIHAERNLVQKTIEQLRSKYTGNDVAITSAMKDFGIKRANLYGWPNTYVFTKAMGEMLLSRYKCEIPLIIIRPTMITSTYKEPFPGWIEGLRTLDAVVGGYGKGKIACFLGHPQTILDAIPADMVTNCILAAMAIHSNKYIYHVSSSLRNSLTISRLHDNSYLYFKNKPFTDTSGKPTIISKGLILSSMASFHAYMLIRFVLPLKALYLVNQVFCQSFRDFYNRNDRKVKIVIRIVQLYKPYVFFKALFDDTNTEELREKAKMVKDDGFDLGFDPKSIDWTDYLMNVHIPGLVNYAMNSSPKLPRHG
ncbi:fatty acyl-CoA reductase 1-like [Prosopis cineraria]|uniref:fatty acyl-CoA reductase 1-like n=1 Tax=Prosopis cineraria TaxID=364024 RepID=UPI00240F8F85|nr:fatty acyl-CoA reductase 1-like [Prosopis cineraria]